MLQIPTADEVLESINGHWANILNEGINTCIIEKRRSFEICDTLPEEFLPELKKKGYDVAFARNENKTYIKIVGTNK